MKGEEIKPLEDDIVVIKLSDGSFQISIVVHTDNDPINATRVVLCGKSVIIEVHLLPWDSYQEIDLQWRRLTQNLNSLDTSKPI